MLTLLFIVLCVHIIVSCHVISEPEVQQKAARSRAREAGADDDETIGSCYVRLKTVQLMTYSNC
jgi:hypothetical protein